MGGEYIRDVDPGEIVVINKKGIKFIKNKEVYCGSLCALEYIYFSRPDSIIDGINLSQFRIKCGEKLYENTNQTQIL
ncbi:hypothetical protein JTS93_03295 [Clostridium botulinum]|nr:hypothetical protein [Clostridium botulinum]